MMYFEEYLEKLIEKWDLPKEENPWKHGDVSYFATVTSNKKNPLLIIKFFTGESREKSQINGSVCYRPEFKTYRPYVMDHIAGEGKFFSLTDRRDEAIHRVRKWMQELYTRNKIAPEKIREILWAALNDSRKIRIVFKEDADVSYVACNLIDMNDSEGIIFLDDEVLKTMMIARVSECWNDDEDRTVELRLSRNFVSYDGMIRFVCLFANEIENIEVVPNETNPFLTKAN